MRWLLRLAVLAGLGFVAWRLYQLLQEDEDYSHEWARAAAPPAAPPPAPVATRGEQPVAEPAGNATAAATASNPTAAATETWVKPDGSTCPPGYPVKAKIGSKVYRLPGMFSYEESKPERCYRDEAAAIADGFTRAKR